MFDTDIPQRAAEVSLLDEAVYNEAGNEQCPLKQLRLVAKTSAAP